MQEVLEARDPQALERLFRDRIVLIGETRRHSSRLDVPIDLAGWEPGGSSSPEIVVQAQALRTALLDAAPVRVSRPWVLVVVLAVGWVALIRDWRVALAAAVSGAVALLVAGTMLLRAGWLVPVGAGLFTVVLAWAARSVFEGMRARRKNRPATP
jgi:CHASE2 domain-containing sensor protein